MLTIVPSESDMYAFGAWLAPRLKPGMVVLASGPLGVGKTTLARGILSALGWDGTVRSPSFNLLHTYATSPPFAHADLYRVESAEGIGLEDVLDSHITMIEWPENLGQFLNRESCIQIDIAFDGDRRKVTLRWPAHDGSEPENPNPEDSPR